MSPAPSPAHRLPLRSAAALGLVGLLGCAPEAPAIDGPADPVVDTAPEPADPVEPVDSDAPEPLQRIVINELMASNRRAVPDPLGGSADWLELHNPHGTPVDLDGWVLEGDGGAQILRDLSLPAGGHRVLWADGRPELGPAHLDFTLPAEGGTLALRAPDATLHDEVRWPQQAPDVAAARVHDGGPSWQLLHTGTPGAPNGEAALPGPLVRPTSPPRCLPQAAPDTPHHTEGDTVTVAVSCDQPILDGALQPLLPDGLDATWADDTLTWSTGPADGGRHDLVFVALPPDDRHIPEAATATVWVADDPTLPDAVPPDPLTYTEEWGLPVVHLDPDGPLTQSWGDATITVDGVAYVAEAKVRGASSVSYPKQSYLLDFDLEELALQGWGTVEHLILTSTFDDNSYVRQKLTFELWEAMAEHAGEVRVAPRSRFMVVYLEGAYHGLYLATERIDDNLVERLGFPDEGNLYKSVTHDANFQPTLSNGTPKTVWHAGYEKKEGEPLDDFSDLDAFVSWTAGSDATALAQGLDDWASTAEFMDWFLLVQFGDVRDSAGKNASFYNPLPPATDFHLAPWDFNASWGQNWYTLRVSSDTVRGYTSTNRVFWALQTDPDAAEALWAHWLDLRQNGPLHPDALLDRLDALYDRIQPSAERDWAHWQAAYHDFDRWEGAREAADDWTDFEGEKAYVYQWITERSALYDVLHPPVP